MLHLIHALQNVINMLMLVCFKVNSKLLSKLVLWMILIKFNLG